jgi:transposase-like protein
MQPDVGRARRTTEETGMPPPKTAMRLARSPKAGRPPEDVVSPPRVRRRQKRARVELTKGTMLLQAAHGPRVLRAAKSPKVKKR